MSALFNLPQADAAKPIRHTERQMLNALQVRYTKDSGNGPRYVYAEHVRNQGGFGGAPNTDSALRTADAIAVDLWPSSGHLVHGFEVKVSRSDWLVELADPSKAEAFKRFCHRWWLVIPSGEILRDDLPHGWGCLTLGNNGSLRIAHHAPKLTPEPIPLTLTAALLRAAVKTTTKHLAQSPTELPQGAQIEETEKV